MQISTLDDLLNRITNTNTTEYSDSDKHDDLTIAAHETVSLILDAQDDFQFQGEISEADLQSVSTLSDREYQFPADLLKIKRIEIDFDGDGEFTPVSLIDSGEVEVAIGSNEDIEQEFSNSDPYAELFDGGFRLYSGSISSNVTKGVKIWYSEELVGEDSSGDDITSFTSDTDKPKIANAFQIGLVFRAGMFFALSKELWEKADRLERQWEKVVNKTEIFYSNRSPDDKMIIMGTSNLEDYE